MRALLCIGLLLCAPGAMAQGMAFVDSLLRVPYKDMVGDLPRSRKALLRAVPLAQAAGDRSAEGHLLGQLSIVHHLMNQVDSATWYGVRAVESFRGTGDRQGQGEALCALGFAVKRTDLGQALDYFRQGLPLLEEEEARSSLTAAYDNYGTVQELDGRRDSALFFYRKALALKEQLNDSNGIPYSLNKIAVALLPDGRFGEALALVQRADTIRRAIHDRMGLADQAAYFGDVYQAWGRYPEALEQYELALQRAAEVGFPYLRQYAYEHLAQCHEALGDHRAALLATKRAAEVRDSIQSERATRTLLELKEQFNAAEKDRAIALLNERSARRQLYIWISLIALVLVAALGLLMHQIRQRRLRAERDAAVIAERDAGLRAVIEATEEERRRLARELHDGVGQQLGGLKHRLEHLRSGRAVEGLQDTIALVDDTAREVRELAHQLMPKALIRLGLVPAIGDLLDSTFTGTGIKAAFGHAGVPDDLPPPLATGVYRITQELVGNILRHAGASNVDVQLLRNKGHLVLIVEDDGRGIAPQDGRDGIGLLNIADRARSLGGSFSIEGREMGGTIAMVRLPLRPADA